ncbi:MAG: hypothetical protein KDA99_16790, partial [Planctomycetales bacterium]|nr:hypothetical protein [Planctomycetales bacterium]
EATEPLDTAAMAATPPVAPVTEAQAEDTNTQTFQEVPRVDKGDIAAAAEDNLPSTQAQAASSAGTADGDLERVARVDTDRQQRPEELIRDGKWYDGRPAPKTYQLRTSSQRAEIARRRGATAETEAAVTEALQWLSSVQSQDGGWDASAYGAGQPTYVDGQLRDDAGRQADMGISGLAILAFLGNGQTHLSGAHRQTVQRGLEYLLRNQGTDGNMSGGAGNFARMYCHGIATLAIGEAYAMTGDPRLKEFIIRAANHTIRSQNVYSGGWRYWPGESGDTSQFGWQVMALMSAQSAGIDIPESTRTLMNRFLQSVTMGQHGGLAAYRPSEAPKRSMTAEAMVCRMFLQGATVPKYQLAEGSRHLLEELPGPGRPNLYYWYYATLALAQRNDRDWQRWNEALQQQLLPRQRHDGQWQGSWDPDTMYGGHGGRIYSTAMATLCLEVYYRYLPIFPDGD